MSLRRLMGSLMATAMLLLLSGAAPAGEGKLDRIKDEVKDHRDGDGGREHHGHGDHDDDDDYDDDDESLGDLIFGPAFQFMFEVTLWALASPFWAPVAITDDRPFLHRPYRFEKYPYAGGAAGHPRPAERVPRRRKVRVEARAEDLPADRPEGTPAEEPGALPEERPRRWRWGPVEGRAASATALFSYEHHSDGIRGMRCELQLRTYSRVNLDLSATDYAEEVGGEIDHMGHFKGHLTCSFAVSRRAIFSAGIGARCLSWEGGDSYGGIDFRYEAEFFPVRPLHLQAIAEGGWIHDKGVWELEGRVGVLLGRVELFAGYRHFHVAGEDLAGPTAGLIVWF